MHHFTPLSGLIGGALIGLASALLMLSAGRPAGVSGRPDGRCAGMWIGCEVLDIPCTPPQEWRVDTSSAQERRFLRSCWTMMRLSRSHSV